MYFFSLQDLLRHLAIAEAFAEGNRIFYNVRRQIIAEACCLNNIHVTIWINYYKK